MLTPRQALRSLLTQHGSPRGIAGGFTLGIALSLLPIPILGMVIALAVAPLLRCNLPATYAGTALVNPITGVFFYATELWLGVWLTGAPAPSWTELQVLDGRGWLHLLQQMVLPFVLGAVLLAIATVILAYPLAYWVVIRWRNVDDGVPVIEEGTMPVGKVPSDARPDPGRNDVNNGP